MAKTIPGCDDFEGEATLMTRSTVPSLIVLSNADAERASTESEAGHGSSVFSIPRALRKADVSLVAKSLKPSLERRWAACVASCRRSSCRHDKGSESHASWVNGHLSVWQCAP